MTSREMAHGKMSLRRHSRSSICSSSNRRQHTETRQARGQSPSTHRHNADADAQTAFLIETVNNCFHSPPKLRQMLHLKFQICLDLFPGGFLPALVSQGLLCRVQPADTTQGSRRAAQPQGYAHLHTTLHTTSSIKIPPV